MYVSNIGIAYEHGVVGHYPRDVIAVHPAGGKAMMFDQDQFFAMVRKYGPGFCEPKYTNATETGEPANVT